MTKGFIIIVIILILILFMPIRLKVSNELGKTNVDMFLIKFFNIRLDIDSLINRIKIKNNDMSKIIKNIKTVIGKYQYIKRVLRHITIKKQIIIVNTNNFFLGVAAYNTILYIRSFSHENFNSIDKECFSVKLTNENKLQYDFEIYFRFVYLAYAFISMLFYKLITILISLRKRGERSERASNKRFVSNING